MIPASPSPQTCSRFRSVDQRPPLQGPEPSRGASGGGPAWSAPGGPLKLLARFRERPALDCKARRRKKALP